jgi:hypothetical protein
MNLPDDDCNRYYFAECDAITNAQDVYMVKMTVSPFPMPYTRFVHSKTLMFPVFKRIVTFPIPERGSLDCNNTLFRPISIVYIAAQRVNEMNFRYELAERGSKTTRSRHRNSMFINGHRSRVGMADGATKRVDDHDNIFKF